MSLCDYKSVITASLPVGVDYKEKLCGIACKLWDMDKQRQDILREISNYHFPTHDFEGQRQYYIFLAVML